MSFEIVKKPQKRFVSNRHPNHADFYDCSPGDEWINKDASVCWKFIDIDPSLGSIWVLMTNLPENNLTINSVPHYCNNFNLLASHPINITNDPKTSTVNVGFEGCVTSSFEADNGKSVPLNGNLVVLGSECISTYGKDNTLSIGLKTNVPLLFKGNTGECSAGGNQIKIMGVNGIVTSANDHDLMILPDECIPTAFCASIGFARPVGNMLNIVAGHGIATEGNGNTIKITALQPQLPQFSGNRGSTAAMSNCFTFEGEEGSGIRTECEYNNVLISLSDSCHGDFCFENHLAGTARKLSIVNHSLDNHSDSVLEIKVAKESKAAPVLQFSLEGKRDYRLGIGDDQYLQLWTNPDSFDAEGHLLQKISPTGVISLPNQPCFMKVVEEDITSITGDGTIYAALAYIVPENGNYSFSGCLFLQNIWPAHQIGSLFLKVNDELYLGSSDNPRARNCGAPACVTYNGAWHIPANGGMKISLCIQVTGGTKVVSIAGSKNKSCYCSYFSGCKVS